MPISYLQNLQECLKASQKPHTLAKIFQTHKVMLPSSYVSARQAAQHVMSIMRIGLHVRTGAMCLRLETTQDLALGAQEKT